jgi:hypothetical protein
LSQKCQFFRNFFGENIFKIITLVPGHPDEDLKRSETPTRPIIRLWIDGSYFLVLSLIGGPIVIPFIHLSANQTIHGFSVTAV